MILACYKKLILLGGSSNVSQRISDFAKIINHGCYFNSLIRECFIQISKGVNLAFHLELLTHLYLETTNKETFLAANSLSIILSQLEYHPEQTAAILRLVT